MEVDTNHLRIDVWEATVKVGWEQGQPGANECVQMHILDNCNIDFVNDRVQSNGAGHQVV